MFQLLAQHPFVSVSITKKISDDIDIQGLLANFRACGGRLMHRKMPTYEDSSELRQNNEINQHQRIIDILDLRNHQKLTVLFCSFSHSSNNAPAFCVDPW